MVHKKIVKFQLHRKTPKPATPIYFEHPYTGKNPENRIFKYDCIDLGF